MRRRLEDAFLASSELKRPFVSIFLLGAVNLFVSWAGGGVEA